MTLNASPSITDQPSKRRRFDPAFKAMIVDLCQRPENSIAQVARDHALNANLVHKWLVKARQQASADMPAFLPVTLPTTASAPHAPDFITLEIDSPLGGITFRGSVADAAQFIKALV